MTSSLVAPGPGSARRVVTATATAAAASSGALRPARMPALLSCCGVTGVFEGFEVLALVVVIIAFRLRRRVMRLGATRVAADQHP